MTDLITRLYDRYDDAESALAALARDGFTEAQISLIGHADGLASDAMANPTRDNAEIGAGLGGALGAGFGLLTGLGIVAIPGFDPVAAVGWLLTAAVGAAGGALLGGALGGIVGALAASGRPETDPTTYPDGARRGGTLVTVCVPEGRAADVTRILDPHRIGRAGRDAMARSGRGGFGGNPVPYVTNIVDATPVHAPSHRSGRGSVPACGLPPRGAMDGN